MSRAGRLTPPPPEAIPPDVATSEPTRPLPEGGAPPVVLIRPRTGWAPPNLRELWEYRDLFYLLVSRDLTARYAQSVLGIAWAVIPPLFYMVVFSVVFGKLARISSDGIPYPIFSYTALVPWMYFSSALTSASSSLIGRGGLLTKVYFPRLTLPLAAVIARLLDFAIGLLLVFGMMAWFGIVPTARVLMLPLLVLLMMLAASGLGIWFAAIAVRYRDVHYGMGLLVHLLMYATPVIFPISLLPKQFRLVSGINPMVGVLEGFRSALLGSPAAMPWDLLGIGAVSAAVVAASGVLYLRRVERTFADVL